MRQGTVYCIAVPAITLTVLLQEANALGKGEEREYGHYL